MRFVKFASVIIGSGLLIEGKFLSVNLDKIFKYKKISNIKYDPSFVDWASVVSGCRASFRYEKRLANFYIRASAHDSLSVKDGMGGADGSLLLTDDELRRPENKHDLFAYTVSKNAKALSEKYGASVADVLAVCAGVAVEFLGGPTIVKYNMTDPFFVGRVDLNSPNPANALAKADINVTEFVKFANNRQLSVEEMTALMGTHSLIDSKGCLKFDKTYCDPYVENCENISMFKFSNSYYSDVCNTKINMYNPAKEIVVENDDMFNRKQELCKYTSAHFKEEAELDFEEAPETTDIIKVVVEVIENGIMKLWNYTVNDAWLGLGCRGEVKQQEIFTSMNKFKDSYQSWADVYTRAYKKMVSIGATWSHYGGFPISGVECPSGYVSKVRGVKCHMCSVSFNLFAASSAGSCHRSCMCRTGFANEVVYSDWI
jgi:hypothetical protein